MKTIQCICRLCFCYLIPWMLVELPASILSAPYPIHIIWAGNSMVEQIIEEIIEKELARQHQTHISSKILEDQHDVNTLTYTSHELSVSLYFT